MAGRYVPPHLRNKAPASAPAGAAVADSPPPRPGFSSSPRRDPPPHSHPLPSDARNGFRDREGPPQQRGHRGPGNAPRRGVTLCVFGDSFGGPFKLLSDSCVKVQTFKGASAKGLNNPNSLKQVSQELVPLLNTFLAPPPFAYMPSTGRSALLMFGNVDLQVNYLWQLQHKPLGAGTWSAREREEYGLKEDGTAVVEEEEAGTSDNQEIMASATENSGKGPALGPELFVDNIVKAFSEWLEREIVNGPIGRRAAEVMKRQSGSPGCAGDRRLPPTKVLVAAALPPLIEDDTLPRIPEKYVERLEEDHVRAHRALERGEKDHTRVTWGKPDLDKAVAGLSLSESKPTPGKESVEDLLAHQPPLCTKPVRVAMTHRYNEAMRALCAKHPSVLAFVDIWDVMLGIDEEERAKGEAGAPPAIPREVDRATWACPVDVSNIHPLWEPTLPLWLKELSDHGVPTETFSFSADAEATFKAYEEDKRRRTEKRDFRIQLRDE